MENDERLYTGADIDVTFLAGRCIHAAECVRRLPTVFNTRRRPWVLPDAAPADAVARVVERCPSGALHARRHDGQPAERRPPLTAVMPQPSGPLYVRGPHLELRLPAAASEPPRVDTRLALCRCGASANKPYCDNGHLRTGFRDAGMLAPRPDRPSAPERDGLVTIEPRVNGPLSLRGPVDVVGADNRTVYRADRVLLCRCGHSATKPFCDGSHERVGFRSE